MIVLSNPTENEKIMMDIIYEHEKRVHELEENLIEAAGLSLELAEQISNLETSVVKMGEVIIEYINK